MYKALSNSTRIIKQISNASKTVVSIIKKTQPKPQSYGALKPKGSCNTSAARYPPPCCLLKHGGPFATEFITSICVAKAWKDFVRKPAQALEKRSSRVMWCYFSSMKDNALGRACLQGRVGILVFASRTSALDARSCCGSCSTQT